MKSEFKAECLIQNKNADQNNQIELKKMEETSLLNFFQSQPKVRGPSASGGEGMKGSRTGLWARSVQTGLGGKVCQCVEKRRRRG